MKKGDVIAVADEDGDEVRTSVSQDHESNTVY